MKAKKIAESFEKINTNDETKERMLIYVLNSAEKQKNSNERHIMGKEFFMKKAVIAAIMTICILTMSGGVYAGYKWLNAKQIISEMGYEKLSKYFDIDKDDILVEENDKYRAAFLGTVSGANINEQNLSEDIDKNLTYIVTAVERKDGKEMADNEIVVSPFIRGVRPMDFNIYTMEIGVASMVLKDGVLYTLTECSDLEIFADRDVYLAVMDGVNFDGYNYDEKSGDITRNEDFEGLNLLFELALDKSKANPEAAQKSIDELLDMSENKEGLNEEEDGQNKYVVNGLDEKGEHVGRTDSYVNADIEGYDDLNNPEKVIRQAKLVKNSEKKLTPDKNGIIKYTANDIDLGTSAKYVKKKGMDAALLYGEGKGDDEILVFTYENGEYIGRLYTCSQSITRKEEKKK